MKNEYYKSIENNNWILLANMGMILFPAVFTIMFFLDIPNSFWLGIGSLFFFSVMKFIIKSNINDKLVKEKYGIDVLRLKPLGEYVYGDFGREVKDCRVLFQIEKDGIKLVYVDKNNMANITFLKEIKYKDLYLLSLNSNLQTKKELAGVVGYQFKSLGGVSVHTPVYKKITTGGIWIDMSWAEKERELMKNAIIIVKDEKEKSNAGILGDLMMKNNSLANYIDFT